MPRFDPFPGIRYGGEDGRLDEVIAPPYDVVTAEERGLLAGRSPYNAVHLEIPVAAEGGDPYQAAAWLWERWRGEGVLVADEPSLYLYRMGFHDEAGRPRQTSGVIGALEVAEPGTGVLPHERTMAKDRTDRLSLLRACRANLSPIWCLSVAEGLSALCEPVGPPLARATDDQGVHHRLWRVSQPALIEAISEAVASTPVVIADGHHRYETAVAYRQERRQARGQAPGGYDAVMAYVVELSEDQLTVQPIHRLLGGLGDFDVAGALSAYFDLSADGTGDAGLVERMADQGALALVTTGGAWLLRPRPETVAATSHALDSSVLDVALTSLPPHDLQYQQGVEAALGAVRAGRAQAAVLVRPATVAQIAEVAHGGERMPPKTTFFHPKPRTGMVFREVPG